MILPLCELKRNRWFNCQIILLYLTNGFLQFLLVYYIWWLYYQAAVDCDNCPNTCGGYLGNNETVVLRLMCIALYACVVSADMFQTISMGIGHIISQQQKKV